MTPVLGCVLIADRPAGRPDRGRYTRVLTVLLVAVCSMFLGGCGATAGESVACLPVSASTVSKIESGLKAGGQLSLTDAEAVKVDTLLYYVSAHLNGSGLSGSDVATWQTDSITDPTSMLAVDGFAKEFSDWGGLAHGISWYDGAQASRDCV